MRNGAGPQQRCSARYDLTPTLAQTPIHSFTADVIMSFLTLLRRVAMTLLFILLPAASGWACTPVFVRGRLHPSAERGAHGSG